MRRAALLLTFVAACGGEASPPGVDAPAQADASTVDGAAVTVDAAPSASTEDSLLGSQFIEGELTMTSGASLRIAIDASHDVEWNVHSHPGSESVTHTSGTDDQVRETFVAPAAGTYYLLVKNPAGADPVDVTAALWFGDGVTFVGWL